MLGQTGAMMFDKVRRCLACGLIAVSPIAGNPRAVSRQQTPATEHTAGPSLQLPSFAIFGLTADAGPAKPIAKKELERFIADARKAKAAIGGAGEPNYYWIVPIVFYRSSGLFTKAAWSKDEIKQGRQLSSFFATLFGKPDLRIEAPDQESFRSGLVRLRNWFVSLCDDNHTLGRMIFTPDAGPFFGQQVDLEQAAGMRVLESVPIPGQQARFVLMTDKGQHEPMVFGIINPDRSMRWLKRLSAAPRGTIRGATFVNRTISKLGGYGYVCELMADWNYGFERSLIYLDESLGLRFYFVSTQ
jgi:hypothetical protein